MIKFKDASQSQLDNFSNISESLLKYIRKYWKGTMKPKGYKAFTEDYEDYDGMEELDQKAIEKEFKGINASGTMSYSFPMQMSLPHTAYNDKCQGRDPLNTLVSAVLGHGMLIGEERGKRKALKGLERIKKTIEIYEKHGTADTSLKELLDSFKFDVETLDLELK